MSTPPSVFSITDNQQTAHNEHPDQPWSVQAANDLYRVAAWSDGYFSVNAAGHVQMHIPAEPSAPSDCALSSCDTDEDDTQATQPIDLNALTEQIQQTGLKLPVLVRFEAILQDRVQRLCQAFYQALQHYTLDSHYTAVYPIKVNQQASVVQEIIRGQQHSNSGVGLEAGSKPELMIILGIAPPNSLIICNGYKDREFIRLALISQCMGHHTIIVIEKLSELAQVLNEAQALNLTPRLGLRVRLASLGKGQWQNTGGEGAKFGLSAQHVLQLVSQLKQAECLACLELLHFHMGSQIADLRDIQQGMEEASRYFVELHRLGASLTFADVGGGLGIDYDGTQSTATYSSSYTIAQYADKIVQVLHQACAEAGLAFPHLLTEAGRYMTAHHAVLISNIIDQEAVPTTVDNTIHAALTPTASSHPLLLALQDSAVSPDLWESQMQAILHAYAQGELNLQERAWAEQWHRQRVIKQTDYPHKVRFADKYFVNFSLFQSLPDIWGIEQVFPIMPLQGLQQPPDRQVVLQDMTCDSDGTIKHYVCHNASLATNNDAPIHSSTHEPLNNAQSLALHALSDEAMKSYYIAFFLVGAYQEILGDLHNLFGDTDSINVKHLPTGGFCLQQAEHGDTVDELLRTIHYEPKNLLAHCKQKLLTWFRENPSSNKHIDKERRLYFYREIEAGFIGYTYLEE
ncbi:MAG: biosynthetic arginine decarboxylase [bacterium]